MSKVKLGDVAVEIRETYKGDKTGIPIVGLEHLIPEDVILSNWDHDTENTFTKMFRKGDMLFGRRRAYLKKAAQAPFDGLCSGDITVIRAKQNNLLPELLPFIIQNENLFDYAVGKSAGSLSPRVKWENLQNFTFELPPLDEQKKLAEVLWSINDTLQAYHDLMFQTDELVKSHFVEMFGDPNESIEKVPFETAFMIRDDLRKPINDSERSEMHENAQYPYYGANGQVDTINQYIMDCPALCLAEDCGSYGPGESTSYIVQGKCWVNNHAHVIIPRACCDRNYANAYFKILDMSSYVSGTTRLKLTQGKMKEIPIVLPDLERQQEFAKFVEESEKARLALQKAIETVSELKKTIMMDALSFTGKE